MARPSVYARFSSGSESGDPIVIDGCSVHPYDRNPRNPAVSACSTSIGITFAPPRPNDSNDEMSVELSSGAPSMVIRKNDAPPVRVTPCSWISSRAHFGSHPSISTSLRYPSRNGAISAE